MPHSRQTPRLDSSLIRISGCGSRCAYRAGPPLRSSPVHGEGLVEEVQPAGLAAERVLTAWPGRCLCGTERSATSPTRTVNEHTLTLDKRIHAERQDVHLAFAGMRHIHKGRQAADQSGPDFGNEGDESILEEDGEEEGRAERQRKRGCLQNGAEV